MIQFFDYDRSTYVAGPMTDPKGTGMMADVSISEDEIGLLKAAVCCAIVESGNHKEQKAAFRRLHDCLSQLRCVENKKTWKPKGNVSDPNQDLLRLVLGNV